MKNNCKNGGGWKEIVEERVLGGGRDDVVHIFLNTYFIKKDLLLKRWLCVFRCTE